MELPSTHDTDDTAPLAAGADEAALKERFVKNLQITLDFDGYAE